MDVGPAPTASSTELVSLGDERHRNAGCKGLERPPPVALFCLLLLQPCHFPYWAAVPPKVYGPLLEGPLSLPLHTHSRLTADSLKA